MGYFVWVLILVVIIINNAPELFNYIREEGIAEEVGEIARTFNESYDPNAPAPVIMSECNIDCLEGKKIITLDGIVYHLGVVKNSWGDLEGVDCPIK